MAMATGHLKWSMIGLNLIAQAEMIEIERLQHTALRSTENVLNCFRLGSENVGRGSPHWGMRALHNLPSRLTLREKRELFAHTFSFSFVRHPFVRLVSTYKSKVLRSVQGESKLRCQRFQRLFNPLPLGGHT